LTREPQDEEKYITVTCVGGHCMAAAKAVDNLKKKQ